MNEIRHICTGCGSEIPEGQDFCYVCGSWTKNALTLDDEDRIRYSDMCLNCGKALPKDSDICPFCGAKVEERYSEPVVVRRPWTMADYLSVTLAIIPGFFNIFGLGQIIQRRWSKAFVFICATVLLFYITPAFLESSSNYWLIIALQIIIFMFSLMDVFTHVGKRED